MARMSFRNPLTNVLMAHGFVTMNKPGEQSQIELDTFNLEPGRWQWNGAQWVPFSPPAPPPGELETAITLALSDPILPSSLKTVLIALLKVVK